MTRLLLDVEFVTETCCYEGCGITWAVTADFKRERQQDHASFFCPNGHVQYYPKKSKEEVLKQELSQCRIRHDRLRDKARRLEHSRRAYMGHVTRLKKAVGKNGQDQEAQET